jgi:osmotically-inducible protein OsmY
MKTDQQLENEIFEELKHCPYLRADNLSIGVTDGVVTLSGEVASLKEKWASEEIVWRVSGVRAVALNIEVNLINDDQLTDTELARRVLNLIDMVTPIHPFGIDVIVEDGVVTLRGLVNWHYQIQHLLVLLKEIRGIRKIQSELTVKPNMQPADVKSRIEASLKRLLNKDWGAINVSVFDGQIVISGYVTNHHRKQEVIDIAWAIPGIAYVEDHLVVDPFIAPVLQERA